MIDSEKLSFLRHEYIKGSLRRKDLPVEPLELFDRWLEEAYTAEILNPTSMVIATVNEFGRPCQRTVLLKHYDKKGLVFYTNLRSPKAIHIKNTPYVSLLFLWNALERQVTITGKAKYLSTLDSERYFRERPRDSQISAWVSKQSSYILNKNVLKNKFSEFRRKFKQKEIPMPNFWGGICVSFEKIEFWQGGKYRLHDRFLYQLVGSEWRIDRLAP